MIKNTLTAICVLISASTAAQVSFTPLPNQPPANIYSITLDPATGDLYACTGTAVIRSTNGGTTWAKLASPGMELLHTLYVTPSGQLYAGGTHTNAMPFYGVVKYNKAANSWTALANSPQDITAFVEDAGGNLFAGTGTTGGISPAPINSGSGVFKYNGSSWTTANTGLANLSGYSVLPFIKDLRLLANGDVVAATYGNGVQKYSSGSWSPYGSGLGNLYVNCLFLKSGTLYAGTDAGLSLLSGGMWSPSGSGITANKPVRAITADGSGQLYAGAGFYQFQKGGIAGEIFSSNNGGASWASAGAGFNSTSVAAMVTSSTGVVFAGACGIWKTASPNSWTYAMSGVSLPNGTVRMVKNQQGDWFVICFNASAEEPGCAGVFRSTDKGLTWSSINNGIRCQRLSAIFVDSYGWLWLGGRQFTGASSTLFYGNPDLYKSADNGATWIKDSTILTPGDGFQQIDEDAQGKLFVTNSFGVAQTNISSSLNHAPFVNNLDTPATNGYKAYGLAINSSGHIFLGTETNGLQRSVTGGTANSFVPITTGAPIGPTGNVSVHIDPNNDYLFCGASHGQMNGTQIAKNIFGSTSASNGSVMFPFNNLPSYASLTAAAFDNRGNAYLYISSGLPNTTQGIYTGSFPWTSSTAFTRLTTVNNLSYYFSGFMTDECGYLYGMNAGGSGIYKSTQPLNTPLPPANVLPADAATGTSVTPTLTWSHPCVPDSFRVQVATDSLFTCIAADQAGLTAPAYTVAPSTLASGTTYFWRVYGVNAAGAGKWGHASRFTTAASSPLPLALLSFDGAYDPRTDVVTLRWVSANDASCQQYTVEKSRDGQGFEAIGMKVSSSTGAGQSNYYFQDARTFPGKSYYRLRRTALQGKEAYSQTILIHTAADGSTISLSPNPVGNTCVLRLPLSPNGYRIIIYDAAGNEVYRTNGSAVESMVSLPLSALTSGQYLLRVISLETGGVITQAFMKN